MANCSVCGENDVCSICFDQFSLTSTKSCLPCNISNCLTCTDSNVCGSCLTSFQLVNNQTCLLCTIANCQSCNSSGLCANCSADFNAVEGLCVKGCPANCLTSQCSNFTGTCFQCSPTFTLDSINNKCFSCNLTNCLSCSGNNICNLCGDSFNLGNGGNCVCPTNSILTNNGTACGCPTNQTFNLDSTGTSGLCLQSCGITDCIQCSTTNGTKCTQCKTGYVVLNNTCSLFCPVANCGFCNSFAFCGKCNTGLAISTFGDACIACAITNC